MVIIDGLLNSGFYTTRLEQIKLHMHGFTRINDIKTLRSAEDDLLILKLEE
jgi:hypothetical protein